MFTIILLCLAITSASDCWKNEVGGVNKICDDTIYAGTFNSVEECKEKCLNTSNCIGITYSSIDHSCWMDDICDPIDAQDELVDKQFYVYKYVCSVKENVTTAELEMRMKSIKQSVEKFRQEEKLIVDAVHPQSELTTAEKEQLKFLDQNIIDLSQQIADLDIQIEHQQFVHITDDTQRRSLMTQGLKWPSNTIYYNLVEGDFTDIEWHRIEFTLHNVFEKHTCLRFVEKMAGDNVAYIKVRKHLSKCSSNVGYPGAGNVVYINLANWCIQPSDGGINSIVHEFMHALGFKHEHQRADRDNYVMITVDTNSSDYKPNNWVKCSTSDCDNQDTPYDYNSVMHYVSDIIPLPSLLGGSFFVQGPYVGDPNNHGGPTFPKKYDWEKINARYPCQGCYVELFQHCDQEGYKHVFDQNVTDLERLYPQGDDVSGTDDIASEWWQQGSYSSLLVHGPPGCHVKLYKHINYNQDENMTGYNLKRYSHHDCFSNGLNDNIKSIRLKNKPSTGCRLHMYQHINYGGYRHVYTNGMAKLGDFNDEYASCKIYGSSCTVSFYQHIHFEGTVTTYTVTGNSKNVSNLVSGVSSFKLSEPGNLKL